MQRWPQPDPVESCQVVQDKLGSSPTENLNTNTGIIRETSSNDSPQPNPEESPQAIRGNSCTIWDRPSILPTLLLNGKKITWSHQT